MSTPPFSISVGMKVRMLVPTTGQDHECIEHTLPAGSIGEIVGYGMLDTFAVDIIIPVDATIDPKDGCYMRSIVNTFDEGDDPLWPFEPVTP